MSYLRFNLFKGLHIKTYFKYVKTIVKQILLTLTLKNKYF